MTRRRLLATAAALVALRVPEFALSPTSGFHLVNGWILTSKDVEALRLYAV
jgi:uncharacterized membrane protein